MKTSNCKPGALFAETYRPPVDADATLWTLCAFASMLATHIFARSVSAQNQEVLRQKQRNCVLKAAHEDKASPVLTFPQEYIDQSAVPSVITRPCCAVDRSGEDGQEHRSVAGSW